MSHIDSAGGRFVTVLPRTRREDGQLRDWMSASTPEFTEAARRPGKRQGDPEQVWRVAPAPFPSSEGHRIVWVHSSAKAATRRDRAPSADPAHPRRARGAQRASRRPARHGSPPASPHDDAAAEIVDTGGAERYVTFTVTETDEERFRQEKRRPPRQRHPLPQTHQNPLPADRHVDADQIRTTPPRRLLPAHHQRPDLLV